ncbi:MAG: cupredoxin domain-containing protein [Candidatus Yanofskybacteria bacterium]|nr:cupredoxin domain-containing protein [Candidatus Yanofskybacteria bacterium]
MNIDEYIVGALALASVVGVAWFFFGKRGRVVAAGAVVDIVVDGGYTPDTLRVPVGVPTTIRFFRKDPSECLEEVVIADLKIRRSLPLDAVTEIVITPPRAGTYRFSCGMGMFHGAIIAS